MQSPAFRRGTGPWGVPHGMRCAVSMTRGPASRSRMWSRIRSRHRWRLLTKGGYISVDPSVGNGLYRVGIIRHHPPIDTYKAGVAGSSPAPPTIIFRDVTLPGVFGVAA